MKSPKNTEKGQILVLLALVIIGLLGMTALAIDGSMIYADRRFTQSVADSASLAGGNAIKEYFSSYDIAENEITKCDVAEFINPTVLALNTAISRADEYYPEIEDKTLSSANITLTGGTFEINTGAINLAGHKFSVSCDLVDKALIVNVELTSETSTAFIQVIDKFIAKNTVRAETKVLANRTLTGPYGIISVSQDFGNKDGGIHFSNNGGVNVDNGGACSNSGINTSGSSTTVTTDLSIDYDPAFPWNPSGNPYIDPDPTTIEDDCVDSKPFAEMLQDIVDLCNSSAITAKAGVDVGGKGIDVDGSKDGTKNTTRTLYQGKHTNIAQRTKEEVMVFTPGLYCLDNTGGKPALNILGGSVTADGVTFVILSGDVQIGGNAGNNLITAEDPDPLIFKYPLDQSPVDLKVDSPLKVWNGYCQDGSQIRPDFICGDGNPPIEVTNLGQPPFLFFGTPWDGHGQRPIISLLGTSQSAFDGLIWAPESLVAIGGTSSSVTAKFGTTIVGYDVSISGNATVDIDALLEGIPAVSGWLDFLK